MFGASSTSAQNTLTQAISNVDFSYFVVGTVHWDLSSNTEEDTEDSLCQRAKDKGYTVYEDYCYIGQAPGATNDGRVSYVNVP